MHHCRSCNCLHGDLFALNSVCQSRERSDGLYRPFTYLVSKLLEELSLVLVVSIIFAAIVFCAQPASPLCCHMLS